jgi:predicted alpha-1,6-mannanase (GH76 family)
MAVRSTFALLALAALGGAALALALPGCAHVTSSSSGGNGTAGSGATGATGATADSAGSSTLPDGGDGNRDQPPNAGAGGEPDLPEAVFDASGLKVVGSAGLDLCRLSDDGQSLRVSVQNGGTIEVGPTQVRVSTNGRAFELSIRTPTLAPGASAELSFDRGPLVGFVADWQFTVVIDPEGKHGGPFADVAGECQDLRSRAQAGMGPLAVWYDTPTGLWDKNDWWTSANQLETVIDYSRQTGDPQYTDTIDNTFVKNQAGDFDRYGYYDDDGWWALSWIKAYDLSGQAKYLDMAKTIFERMTGGWDAKCGGGLYWASAKAGSVGLKSKNAIPNSLFLQIAAKLHQRTSGDVGPGSYLDWAQREWNWFKSTGMLAANHQVVDSLNNLTDCKPSGPAFTYNQGVLLGALVDLAASDGDSSLLDEADAIARATMTTMVDASGTLREAPCGGDVCTQFKGVFMRNLAHLYAARPALDLQKYMRHQSDVLWAEKNAQSQFGYQWQLPFDKATASRQSSALDALVAAVSSSNLNLALGATASGSAPCTPTQGAAHAIDGSSRWESKWCAGGLNGQTLSLDLGAARRIVGFRIRHAGAGGENSGWNTRDFELETSTDNDIFSPAVSVTGNTADITTHPIRALNARYVRLHVSQSQTDLQFLAARIYELEVFGVTL